MLNTLCGLRTKGALVAVCIALWIPGATAVAQESGDYIHYQLGMKYRGENKFDLAVEEFQKVLAAYPDNYNAYMQLAEIQLHMKQPRYAVYNLKQALAYNPGWGKAHKIMASAYEQDGQFEKAVMEMQLYQGSCDPAERDSIQARINTLMARSQGKVPAAGPVEPVVKPGSARVTTATGKEKRGVPSARKSAFTTPQAETLFKKGVVQYDAQEYDSSLAIMQKVIVEQPRFPGAYYYAGMIRRRKGQNDLAMVNFLKATEYPELGYNSHFYLGKILGEGKNYKEAIRHLELYIGKTASPAGELEARGLVSKYRVAMGDSLRQVSADSVARLKEQEVPLDLTVERQIREVSYQPLEMRVDTMLFMVIVDTLSDPGQKMLAGFRAFREGKFDNAIAEFKKVLIAYPKGNTTAQCLYNMGVCYYKMHLFAEAENQFQQVLDRYGTNPLAVQSAFLKALSYLERKEPDRAELLLRDFIVKNPKHQWVPKAYEKLGDAYREMDKIKMAVDAYAQSLQLSTTPGDRVYAGFKLATAYMEAGNTAKGVSTYEKVIEEGERASLYVRVPDSYYRLADLYYQQKNYPKALDLYKGVTRKYGPYQETPWGLFQIGNVYKNQHKFKDAVEIYKELMRKYPDDYWSRQAQWKVDDAVWESEYQEVLK